MFQKNSIYIIISLSLLFSCETKDNINSQCDTDDPFTDIEWLGEIKQVFELRMGMAGAQIIRYQYNGDYVFWVDPCYNCPDGIISIYNCQGEVICEFGGIDGRNTCPCFHNSATDSTMLFNNVQYWRD